MEHKDVPYLVHEGIMTRLERTIERLWILAIILIVLLVGTNVGWLYFESQFEDKTETTITQDVMSGEGDATINDGVHINDGKSKANDKGNQD